MGSNIFSKIETTDEPPGLSVLSTLFLIDLAILYRLACFDGRGDELKHCPAPSQGGREGSKIGRKSENFSKMGLFGNRNADWTGKMVDLVALTVFFLLTGSSAID